MTRDERLAALVEQLCAADAALTGTLLAQMQSVPAAKATVALKAAAQNLAEILREPADPVAFALAALVEPLHAAIQERDYGGPPFFNLEVALRTVGTWHERTLVPIREQVARLEQEIRAGEFIASVKDMMQEGVEKMLVENMLALIADELAAIKKALEP